ncbi:MAG: hypothetical protein EBR09_13350 [Proteobacteria bacterium]|nr:hypothetical protein [Pseudomonadota bacterium]
MTAPNAAPTLAAGPAINGAYEDVPFNITYDMVRQATVTSDDQAGPVKYLISHVFTADGSLSKAGAAVVANSTLLQVTESLTWTPAANKNSAIAAFKVKAVDDQGAQSGEEIITINVTAVNDLPSVTAQAALVPPVENAGKTWSYANINSALTVIDPDFATTPAAGTYSFRIERSGAGSLYQGTTAGGTPITANMAVADMPILKNSTAGTPNAISDFYWMPPANGSGEFTVMTVRVGDGSEYSATTWDIKVTITDVNSAPTWSAAVASAGNVTLGTGTIEGGAIYVSYDALKSLTGLADSDGQVPVFKISAVNSGTVSVNNAPAVASVSSPFPTLAAGESLVWRPAANANGNLSAFTVTGTDGTLNTATDVIVKANVTTTNSAPAIGTLIHTITGVTRNVEKVVTVADLSSALSISDADNATSLLVFQIESLVTGQSLRFGDTSGTASTYPSGSNRVGSTGSFWWMPPRNQTGTFDAFRVTVVDPSNLSSPQVALIRMTVDTGSNAQPVLAAVSNTYDLGSRGVGMPIAITYDDLKLGAAASDDDSAYISFVITELTNSTIKKGSVTMTTTTVASQTSPVPATTSIISPSESIVVTPTAAAGNDRILFKVLAWDGVAYSAMATPVSVIVDLLANNQTPVLTYVRDFTGAVKNTISTFTYDQLRGDPSIVDGSQRTNALDPEEALPVKSLQFIVKSIYSGSLCISTDTSCASPLNAPQTITTASTFKWKPPTDTVGRIKAFSVVAYDGTVESSTPVDVYFQVAGTNTPPVLGTVTTFTGAYEDVPFNISYDLLKSRVPVSDDQVAPVDYKITGVDAGTLVKNYSTAVVAGTTTLSINETLTWTPAANVNNSVAAFRVKGVDSSGAETSEATVTILVTAVNDAPVVTGVVPTIVSPTAPAKRGTKSFSYSEINGLFTGIINNPEGTDTISYRIESFGGAGTLTAGSTAGGASINPNGTAASMFTLMQTPSGAASNISAVYWQAPNSSGTFKLMSVRVFDGTDYAATTADIYVTIPSSNAAPSVGGLTTITHTSNVAENGALPISFTSLHSQINATDADADVVSYKIMSIQTGTLSVNGAAAVASITLGSEPVFAAGQNVVWYPAANDQGTGKSAFTVKAVDPSGAVSDAVAVRVNVSPVNSAPTMASMTTTINSITRNVEKEVSHATLISALGISDVEDTDTTTLKLVISDVVGTLKIGNSLNAGSAIPFNAASNAELIGGKSLYWTPPVNQTGVFTAFKLVVVDTGNVNSSQIATVSMNIDTGSNSKTVLNAAGNTYNLGSRGRGLPIQVTYDQLKLASNAADSDNDVMSFVVTSLDNSTTITKGVSSISAVTVSSDTSPVPLTTNIVSPNETITVYPSATATLNTLTDLFKFRAWDGQVYSLAASQVTVKATFTAANALPTLTYVRDFTTGTKNTTFVFTYDDLRGNPTITDGTQRTDAYDAEEVVASRTLNFRIKSVNASSYLCLNTSATCDAATTAPNLLSAGSNISTGVTYKWAPPTGATGRVNAFDVVVHDGTSESATTIPVYVWLRATNTTPTITGATPLTGATEDVPFAISWDTLRANYPYSDDQSGPVRYEITGVQSGALRMNGVLVTAGVTQMTITDRLEWTPAANENGLKNAFTVQPVDDVGAKPTTATPAGTPTQVQVLITSVNDIPVVTSAPTALANIAKNAAQSLSYSTINTLFSGKLSDLDFTGGTPTAGAISYRIERKGSGTLYKGSSTAGAQIDPTTSATMPTLVDTVGSQPDPVTSVYWVPPANAEGTFTIMTVRPFDGTDYANTAYDISVTITSSNTAPAWSASLAPSYNVTMSQSVSENGTLPITYSALSTAAPATDADGNLIKYRIISVSSGSLTMTVSGVPTTYTTGSSISAAALLGAGETLQWSPPANIDTALQTAFIMTASDGTDSNAQNVTVKVTVNAVNSAPVIAGPYTDSAVMNTWKEVTYSNLITYLGATDIEAGSLSLEVKSLVSGQSLKVGNSGNVSVPPTVDDYSASNNTLVSGKSIYWKPATNYTGTTDAVRFAAVDAGGLYSPTQALLRMTVTGTNAAPTITGTNYSMGTNYPVGKAFSISYASLAAALSANDTDGAYVTLVLTSISNGTIKKGSTLMTAMTGASPSNVLIPSADAQLVTGESMVFLPTSTTTGSAVTLATVRGWDGLAYSSNEVTLQATFVAAANQIPVLTYVRDFTTGTKDAPFVFSYDDLRGNPAITDGSQRSDAYDSEEIVANKTLRFRIKAINAGSKLCLSTDACNVAGHYLAAGYDLAFGTSLKWLPPSGLTGRVNAFDVVAYDSTSESTATIPVYVWLKATNTTPSITGTTPLAGAVEDVPFAISWDTLRANYPYSDDQAGPIKYEITAVSTGSLKMNGTAVVAGSTQMTIADRLEWTPAANDVGTQNAFTVKPVDDVGAKASTATQVQVIIAAVNDIPVVTSAPTTLANITKNVAQTYTHTNIDTLFSTKITDLDFTGGTPTAGAISYRIERVSSGTLYAGSSSSGAQINPTTSATMYTLVNTVGGQTNPITSVYWVPPTNAEGTFTIMTVRPFDGTDYANTAWDISVTIGSSNVAPVWSSSVSLASHIVTLASSVSENGALPVTYSALSTAAPASDADGQIVKYRIYSVSSGSLTMKISGVEYTYTSGSSIPANALLSPGETLTWSPPANVPTANQTAFVIRATDGTLENTANNVTVTVNVNAVNSAPTIAGPYTESALMNQWKEIPFETLRGYLGATDTINETANASLILKVESLMFGQSLKIGNSSDEAGSQVYSGTNNTVIAGKSIYWKAATNYTGTTDAVKFSVSDGSLTSVTQGLLRMAVTGTNAAPTITGTNYSLGASYPIGKAFSVSYATLATALNPQDSDGAYVTFVVTSITNGSIKKGATTMVAATGASQANPIVPSADAQLVVGESAVFFPTSTTTGTPVNLATVRGWDGTTYSTTEVTLQATFIAATNQVPVLTYVRDFTTGTKNAAFVFSYDDLRGDPAITNGTQRTDAYDAEEIVANKTLTFKIKSVNASAFLCTNVATCNGTTAAADRIIADEFLVSNTSYKWVPPTDATGRINAFDIVVNDGTSDSATTIPVYVWLKATNTTPSITGTTPLAGAVEDVPFAISWDTLRANYPYSDDQSGPIKYKISAVSTGSLKMNGSPVVAGTTQMTITDRLEWTPALNANGTLSAFTVTPVDDMGAEAGSPTQVQVIVAAVNDIPVVSSAPTALASIVKDTAQTLSYTTINNLFTGKITDAEANTIAYRIERVSSGTLYSGSSSAGAQINPTTSANMYTLVSSVGSQTNPVTSVYWVPPTNAEGTFTIMTLRPYDGTDYSNTAWDITVTIGSSNAAPTWATVVSNASHIVTVGTSVNENGVLPITYSALNTAAPASDADGQVVKYRIASVTSGTLTMKVGGVTSSYTSTMPANAVLSAGETLLWAPPANLATAVQNAFVIAATDGTAENGTTVAVRVTVNAVNSAPVIVGPKTYTTTMNTWTEVTYSNLITDLGVSDDDGDTLTLKVESIFAGQSLKIGTSGGHAGATAYSGTNNTLVSGKSLYWLSATNYTGTTDAVKLSAYDPSNVFTASQGLVRMTVSGTNTAPTISGTNQSMGTNYPVGKPFSISYSTLSAGGMNPSDTDSSYVTLVITSISNGTIKKGSTTMVAMTGASQANPVIPTSDAQLAPGETLVFFPTSTTTGSAVTLATVRGWDGLTYSTNEVTLQAQFVATTNQIPVLTYVKDFTGAVKGGTFAFTYDSLRGDPALMSAGTQRTDAYDAEENIASKSLKFRVKGITAGTTLVRTPSTTLNVGDTLDPSQSFTWTPSASSEGRTAAFTIVAYDNTNEGSNSAGTPIQVYVYINKDPTFTNSTNLITGVTESSPYVITYDKLFTTFPSSDDSTGILGYQISNVASTTGTLQRYVSGVLTTVTAPYTMYPGDQVIWTPPQYQNVTAYPTHHIFKMKLVDNEGQLSSEINVLGTVAAVNDAPVIVNPTTPITLTGSIAKNASKVITYDDIFGAVDLRDYDFNTAAKPALADAHGITFRIESVNSGTLVGSGGTTIAPTPGNTSSMKYLVKSGSQDLSSSWYTTTWTPPNNYTGTFLVMKVRLFDGQDWSDSVASIYVTVTAGNNTPTYTTSPITFSPGINENGALLVKYSDLLGYTGAADADGDLVKFKVSYLNSGSVTVNGTTYSTQNAAIGAEPSIGVGEAFVWKPSADANGTLAAFRVKLTDTVNDSAEIQANVIVSAINSAPTLGNTSFTITGATRYTTTANPFPIAYSTLIGASYLNPSDPDIGAGNYTITVTNLLGGQKLSVTSSANPTCASITGATWPSTVSITSGEFLCWTPPASTTGTVQAFRVQVADPSGALSGQTALVSVNITGSDTAPSFQSGCYGGTTANSSACASTGAFMADATYYSTFDINKSGSGSGTSLTLTYERLKALSGSKDIDSAPIQFVVTYINSGMLDATSTLVKNGSGTLTVYTGTLPTAPITSDLIGPGEYVTYTLGSTKGSTLTAGTVQDVFGFKLYDGSNIVATEKRIKVVPRAAAAQVPTVNFSAPIPLYAPVGGSTGLLVTGQYYRLTYEELRLYIDAYDLDDPNWNASTLRVVGGGTWLYNGTITSGLFTNVSAMYRDNSSNCSSLLSITNGVSNAAGLNNYSEFNAGNAICFQINSAALTNLNNYSSYLTILQVAIVQSGSTVAKYVPIQIRRGD